METYSPAKVAEMDWDIAEIGPVCGLTASAASKLAIELYGDDAAIQCDQTRALLATVEV